MGVTCTCFRPCSAHWDGFVRRPSGYAPSRTYLALEVRHEYLRDEFMPRRAGEDGVDKVLLDRLGIAHVVGEEGRFDEDVWDVVDCVTMMCQWSGPTEPCVWCVRGEKWPRRRTAGLSRLMRMERMSISKWSIMSWFLWDRLVSMPTVERGR